MLKLFAVLTSSVLHNYFDDSTKLFSDLYVVKFSEKNFNKTVLSVVIISD